MTPELFLNNLAAWALQALIIVSIGAVLPRAFRIRHPRSHLAYCHLLLAAGLMLPLIQPWQHPLAVVWAMPASAPVTASSSVEHS